MKITEKMTEAGLDTLRRMWARDRNLDDHNYAARRRLVGEVFSAMAAASAEVDAKETDAAMRLRVLDARSLDATQHRDLNAAEGAELDTLARGHGVTRLGNRDARGRFTPDSSRDMSRVPGEVETDPDFRSRIDAVSGDAGDVRGAELAAARGAKLDEIGRRYGVERHPGLPAHSPLAPVRPDLVQPATVQPGTVRPMSPEQTQPGTVRPMSPEQVHHQTQVSEMPVHRPEASPLGAMSPGTMQPEMSRTDPTQPKPTQLDLVPPVRPAGIPV